MTSKELVDMHKSICGDLSNIYEKKNHDYSDSFHETIDKFGFVAACVCMEHKMNRVMSLTSIPDEERMVVADIFEDTLLDLANYAIMTVMELRRRNTYEWNTGDLVGREEL